jgi:2-polyprenyl-3-methyl-5-hydroxy-6-metoxy-1,4-benzoquinol methylase
MGTEPLRETDIRPADLMGDQAARFQRDVDRLLAHRDAYVTVPCPACGSDRTRPAMEKMGFSYQRCQACLTMYVSPRPRPEHLGEYYAKSENYQFWAEHIFPASEGARLEAIVRPRVARLLALCRQFEVPTGTLVEVGPGFGTFSQEVQAQGAFDRVIAVEPTPELAAACRDRGVQVIEKAVEDVTADELPEVDVLASFEVIEHLFRPVDVAESYLRLLRPGGLLVLSCPNGEGFEVKALGPLSDTVDPEHLNYFNPASLSLLLTNVGFEVEEVLTPGRLDAELVAKHLPLPGPAREGDDFLHQVLVDDRERLADAFQALLARFGWSSHMWVVARRPG